MEPTGTTACPAVLALPLACSARCPQPAPARPSPPPATPSLCPHARAPRPGTALCSHLGIQAKEVDVKRSEPRGSKELGTHPEVPQKTAPLQHGDMEAQARQPTPLLPRQCRPRVCGNWAVFCRLHGPPVCGATGQGSQPLLQALVFATRPPPPPVPCGFERSLSQGTSGRDEACHSALLLPAAPRGGPEADGGHGFRPGPARHLGSLPAQGHRHRRRHRLGAPAGNGARSAPQAASLWG